LVCGELKEASGLAIVLLGRQRTDAYLGMSD
jgi:hypothetical protein